MRKLLLLLAVVQSTAAFAKPAKSPTYIRYEMREGEYIALIMRRLQVRPLWGKKGFVQRTIDLNRNVVDKDGNFTGTARTLRLPFTQLPNNATYTVSNGVLAFQDHVPRPYADLEPVRVVGNLRGVDVQTRRFGDPQRPGATLYEGRFRVYCPNQDHAPDPNERAGFIVTDNTSSPGFKAKILLQCNLLEEDVSRNIAQEPGVPAETVAEGKTPKEGAMTPAQDDTPKKDAKKQEKKEEPSTLAHRLKVNPFMEALAVNSTDKSTGGSAKFVSKPGFGLDVGYQLQLNPVLAFHGFYHFRYLTFRDTTAFNITQNSLTHGFLAGGTYYFTFPLELTLDTSFKQRDIPEASGSTFNLAGRWGLSNTLSAWYVLFNMSHMGLIKIGVNGEMLYPWSSSDTAFGFGVGGGVRYGLTLRDNMTFGVGVTFQSTWQNTSVQKQNDLSMLTQLFFTKEF